MAKPERLRFSSSNFGEHLITADYENGDQETVRLDIPKIVKDREMLREVLNGLGNLMTSISCHLYTK